MKIDFTSDRKELSKQINFELLFDKLEQAFKGLKSKSTLQPEQLALVAPNGDDCIIYAAADFANSIVGVKLSPYINERASRNLNPVSAYTFLLSMTTGEPILICNSFSLTAMRTAATTILAVSKLSPNLNKLAIIGFGPVGQEHLRCALKRFKWNNVQIFSPRISRDNSIATKLIEENDLNPTFYKIDFANTLETAVKDADVIMMCTSSKTEVLDLSTTKESCIITSIVTNSPTAHEIKPHSLIGCDIFCDYLPNSLNVAGEFKILKEENAFGRLNIKGDLVDLCTVNNSDLVNSIGRKYFRSVGLGIEDIIIASTLV